MRVPWLLIAVAMLGGCGKPEAPATTRPDWRSATVDGIAPLMTPDQVESALTRQGYVQVKCTESAELLVDPLRHGNDIPCYRSPTRAMSVSLYFLNLNEGRRLAVVNYHAVGPLADAETERLTESRAFARRVRAHFGSPSITSKGMAFRTFYWKRPGGDPLLPDMISTTVGADFPPNLTMTSMWAYGEQRSDR